MGEISIQKIEERFDAAPLWRVDPMGPSPRGLAFTHLRFGIY
jgi:hypothetical protein